ncbi:hypothetical protein CC80DRAFT_125807 [Byssothecium circinans]|uniref:Uncharacterized protein n=1 Tax=Byssothecium circinans TaxID=147558 RepID=A0A6A5TNW2_9PLEO|nr:hypothetical protein CC80DRAFT_125807 [Byssothecium circinans]
MEVLRNELRMGEGRGVIGVRRDSVSFFWLLCTSSIDTHAWRVNGAPGVASYHGGLTGTFLFCGSPPKSPSIHNMLDANHANSYKAQVPKPQASLLNTSLACPLFPSPYNAMLQAKPHHMRRQNLIPATRLLGIISSLLFSLSIAPHFVSPPFFPSLSPSPSPTLFSLPIYHINKSSLALTASPPSPSLPLTPHPPLLRPLNKHTHQNDNREPHESDREGERDVAVDLDFQCHISFPSAGRGGSTPGRASQTWRSGGRVVCVGVRYLGAF